MLRLFCDCCWFALLAGGLLLTLFSPFSEPTNKAKTLHDVTLQRLDRLSSMAEKPRKLVATASTVFILDGKQVSDETFLETKGVIITEVHTAGDGKTLKKLVGTTKEE